MGYDFRCGKTSCDTMFSILESKVVLRDLDILDDLDINDKEAYLFVDSGKKAVKLQLDNLYKLITANNAILVNELPDPVDYNPGQLLFKYLRKDDDKTIVKIYQLSHLGVWEEYSLEGQADAKINEIKVNGISVPIVDKVAELDLSDYARLNDLTVGRSFTTTATVGHLEAGTEIKETDKLADILYKILYSDVPIPTIIQTYGGAVTGIPSSLDELTEVDEEEGILVSGAYERIISCGDPETEEGQHACIALPSFLRVNTWVAKGAEQFLLPFNMVDLGDYHIYYLVTESYDEDLGGTEYILDIVEV